MAFNLYDLGQALGGAADALQTYNQRASLADLGRELAGGDYKLASQKLLAMGQVGPAINLMTKGQELEQQRAADAGLAGVLGGGVSPLSGGMPAAPVAPSPALSGGGGPFNVSKAYELVKSAGGTDDEARTLAAIAQAESSGNPQAHNERGPDDSYGLWQINMKGGLGPERLKQLGLSKPDDLYDPATNARAALAIERARGGFDDWSTYKSGAYKPFMGQGGPVQVADASGAVPASAVPAAGPDLEGQRAALMRRLDALAVAAARYPNASATARAGIDAAKEAVNRQLRELDRLETRQQRVEDRTDNRRYTEQLRIDERAFRDQQRAEAAKDRAAQRQTLSATDKKAILEADEGVSAASSAIDALKEAKKLSPRALGGYGAGMRAVVGANAPDYLVPDAIVSPQAAEATQDLDNLVGQNALSQLKAIFGGNPTEGERAIMMELQGSSSKTDAVRQKIYDRAVQMAQARLAFNRQRADELRGGSYFQTGAASGGGGGATGRASPSATPSWRIVE